ncbi:MAG: hypothetical protein GX568_05655 [Candidatus Gastranaerophilales bacterium]|nr:hypothetical protein [Candidatus Gastranaerophilales bacterium]
MLNWFLTKLTDYWEKKYQKQMGGIPMCWVIYQSDKPKPNMVFSLHPMFADDELLNSTFKGIADYMRDKYLEVEDKDGTI